MKNGVITLLAIAGVVWTTSSCATWSRQRVAPGSRHVVSEGDTLWSIARRCHIPIAELMEVNSIASQEKLKIGHILYIPQTQHEDIFLEYNGPRKKPPAASIPPRKKRPKKRRIAKRVSKRRTKTAPRKTKSVSKTVRKKRSGQKHSGQKRIAKAPIKQSRKTSPKSIPKKQPQWKPQWPLSKATILKRFNPDYGGVALAAALGSQVVAADAGEVMYAGNMGNRYGQIVILKHPPRKNPARFITIYAHLQNVAVSKQTVVSKGQHIGTVGTSGGVPTPRLHFQVRKRRIPVDPLRYLKPLQ
ncbi:MAG: M23 family metallopeptidase [Myxococcota bacterium]